MKKLLLFFLFMFLLFSCGDDATNQTKLDVVQTDSQGVYVQVRFESRSPEGFTRFVPLGKALGDKEILFDNFEDTYNQGLSYTFLSAAKNRYVAQIDIARYITDSVMGQWFFFADEMSSIRDGDGHTVGTIHGDATKVTGAFTPIGEYGSGMYVSFHVYGMESPRAGCAVYVDKSSADEYADLSNMTAVSFDAKGAGEMKVGFATFDVMYKYGGATHDGTFGRNFMLTDSWQRYTIPIEDFELPSNPEVQDKGITWPDVAGKVLYMEFSTSSMYGKMVDETVEFYLDNITFHGMEYSDFGFELID